MRNLTMNEIQHRYRDNKIKKGFKRVQLWTMDERSAFVQEQVKKAAKTIKAKDEGEVMKWVEHARKDIYNDWK